MSSHWKKPLNADEIEALLRTARETQGRADVVSSEPLGPGDVQHLRNTDLPADLAQKQAWPVDVSTEELLHQAESHLADAMSADDGLAFGRPAVSARSLPAVKPQESADSAIPLSMIGDIELDVTLELGRAELLIEDLLTLREGSVVTLDKEAGDPVDILANGKLIARGEVIVVDDKFCVRICEVIG